MESLMMHGGTVTIENRDDEKSPLNKNKDETPLTINRGVELLLRNKRRRKRRPRPKTFQVEFSFFKWEITLSLDIKKKESLEE